MNNRRSKESFRKKSFTLFIDNIHPKVNNKELKTIFQSIGDITDAFISRKKRPKTEKMFGFIRYGDKGTAMEAIRRINGRLLEGEKLFVKWARFEKEEEAGTRNFVKK